MFPVLIFYVFSPSFSTSELFLDSTSSPTKNSDSGINEKMARKNTRLQLESSNWTSESGGYNNLNVSVAEEMKESVEQNENYTLPVQGWLL